MHNNNNTYNNNNNKNNNNNTTYPGGYATRENHHVVKIIANCPGFLKRKIYWEGSPPPIAGILWGESENWDLDEGGLGGARFSEMLCFFSRHCENRKIKFS